LRTPAFVACWRFIGVADFKCGLKIASGKCDGNLFVKRRSVFYWLAGVVIAVIVVIVAFHFDDAMRNFIAQHQTYAAKNFMRQVSRLGDWPEHFALGAALAAIAWWRGNKKWTRVFISMLLALALAGAAARVIKIATGRARPSVKIEETWNGPRLSEKFHAFPSGHTAASTAFFAVLFFASWRIGLACLPIPLLIGFSRMYVAAHYLSDVVCAALLGVLCAFLAARLLLSEIPNRRSLGQQKAVTR
jgi:membrane-associated phospholipid phosphatase